MMTRKSVLLVLAVVVAVQAPAAQAVEVDNSVRFGYVFMADWLSWRSVDDGLNDAVGPLENGSEFRRVRLWAQGTLSGRVLLDVSFDIKSGEAILRNAFAEFIDIPYVGRFRVGHTREPFSIEEMTTSRYVSFMEFASPTALAPGRNIGFLFHNDLMDHKMAWAAGVFQAADQYGDSIGAGTSNLTMRVTGLPFRDEDDHRYLHVGAAYSFREPVDGAVRYESKPELNLAPWYVDTGDADSSDEEYVKATSNTLLGFEMAGSFGSSHFQTEFMRSKVTSPTGTTDIGSRVDPYFWGWYIQIGHFFTGEHRTYDNWNGAFEPVVPKTNFLKYEGAGALELVGRYSTLDLTDASNVGGALSVISFAGNWYMAPHVRVIVEYSLSRLEGAGGARGVAFRFQADF